MPNRANSFASALLGGVLTGLGSVLIGSALLGVNVTASAAGECLESPNQRTAQPGHWYYYSDRAQNRRCWFFQASEARSSDARSADVRSSEVKPAEAPASPPAASPPAAYQEYQQSLLSRFAAGFTQPSPAPPQQQIVPQQYAAPEDPAATPRAAPPKPARVSKASRREHERPATTGAASAERQQDQSQQPAPAAEKDEKPTTPVNVADREALYQDYMKWQRNRTAYGVRW